MKVVFGHLVPFSLAHGGLQIQISQTKEALEKLGVTVEFLRWWDEAQSGDLFHFFGRPNVGLVEMAHQKGIPFVFTDLLTAQGSRPTWARAAHRLALRCAESILPKPFAASLPSHSFSQADAVVALTSWEGRMMTNIYGAPPNRVHVIPNGVEEVFFNELVCPRGEWLVCTATITPRKRVLELAKAAVLAESPLWVIGKPYSERDPYVDAFRGFAKDHPSLIRYEGPISDRAKLARIYREARGFVLLSQMESLSLSALEATACECPLLLSDLPWARETFGRSARYCPITSVPITGRCLRSFYEESPSVPATSKPATWQQVAQQLSELYRTVLSTSL